MTYRSIAASLALVCVAACDASTGGSDVFITREGATVRFAPGGQDFTVDFRAGARSTDYWCAAGRATQGRFSAAQPIYLVSSPGFPAAQPVSFSVNEPAGGGQPTGLNTISSNQNSVSGTQARSLCSALRNQGRR